MIRKLLFCVLALTGITAKSQSPFPSPFVVPNVDWIKYYSQADIINAAPTAIDGNSNVYTTGFTGTGASVRDLLAMKYDSSGVQIFAYPYDNGGADQGRAIKVDAAGNSYIAGFSEDNINGTSADYIIIKLSPTGTPIWNNPTRFDGGAGGGIDMANDICVDANGDVYVTGQSQTSNGDYDIITLKINGSTGAIIWQHPYSGGAGQDAVASKMVLSSDGQKVYITGYTFSAASGEDIVTYALNTTTGSYFWSSPVLTSGPSIGNDRGNAIILAGANVVVCGQIDNTANGSGLDYTTIKFDGGTGTQMWKDDYDKYNANDRATSLARDSAGNIGVVGIVDNNGIYEYHTVFYDSTGVRYGTVNEESTGLSVTSVDPKICNDTIAHHWYVCGEVQKATKDILVYQITPGGTTAWSEPLNGGANGADAATGVVVNGIGVVYVGALSKNWGADYDYTTIKLNQTPCYWPPDFANEPVNNSHLYFKNKGQILRTDSTQASEVLYYTHNTRPEIFVEQDAFNFVFKTGDTISTVLDTIERIQYKFIGANTLANHHEYLPKLTNHNYYLGYALTDAIENVQGNERIFVPNFYPYIDLHYFSGAGGVKFYWVIKPGAYPSEWRMQVNGSVANSIDGATGNLVINGNLGDVELEKPIAYTVNWLGNVVPLMTGSAAWNSLGSDYYNFTLPSYNPSWPLIIEVAQKAATVPAVSHANLDYSTYYGGMGNESFNDIAAAANGDRHVTGWTDSQYFPHQSSMFPYKANKDIIVLKYTADDTLRVASFMGGTNEDVGNSVAVNSNNEVFVGGYTWSLDFPTKSLNSASNQTVNGKTTVADYQDGILAKFVPVTNAQGKPTLGHNWGRYFGGPGNDAINSICLDGSGNLHFVGEAKSASIPGLVASAQLVNSASNNSSDAILGKFDTNLAMVYGTFFGGTNPSFAAASRDIGMDIVTDNSGRAIICGRTDATNFPVGNFTGNNNTFYDPTPNSTASYDGFIARFSPTGVKQFASYFGGTGIDAVTRLAHDPLYDDIYFAGDAYDTTAFPFLYKANALNSRYKTYRTAFVGQMGGDLTKKWCSFYGHGTNSAAYTTSVSGLCVDGYGVLYMSGVTTSDTIYRPSTQPPTVVYKDSIKNSTEGFIAIFNPDQSLYHAHYFGGSNVDQINGADISQGQKLYVVGNTASNNFPIAYNTINATLIDSVYNGGDDGFISRFDLVNYQITGLDESDFTNSTLSVYPNPTSTGFNLDMQTALTSKVNLKVFNMMGQLIYEQTVNDKKTAINCESWTNGVYLITVSDAQSQRTFKLIKN